MSSRDAFLPDEVMPPEQFIPVVDWLRAAAQTPKRLIAETPRGAVTGERFVADVLEAIEAIRTHFPMDQAVDTLIDSGDSTYDFTVLFIATLVAGHTPVLTGSSVLDKAMRATPERVMRLVRSRTETEAHLNLEMPTLTATCVIPATDPTAPVTLPPLSAIPALSATAKLVLYTSGSSGAPKRIEKTLQQMRAEMDTWESDRFQTRWDVDDYDGAYVAMTVDPHHLYGLTFGVFYPLSGAMVMVDERVRYEEQCIALGERLATKHQRWVLVTTPTFMERLSMPMTYPPISGMSAGGVLTERAWEHWCRFVGVPLDEIYGSTETGVVGHRYHRFEDRVAVAEHPWRITTMATITLETKEGDTRARLRSPLLPAEEAQAGRLLDDRLTLVDERTFRLLGRADRIVKVGEERISLADVEAALKTTLGLTAYCCRVRRAGRDQIGAVVVSAASPTYDACAHRAYRAALRGVLAPLAIPRLWRSVDELPINARGKVDRAACEALFREVPDARGERNDE